MAVVGAACRDAHHETSNPTGYQPSRIPGMNAVQPRNRTNRRFRRFVSEKMTKCLHPGADTRGRVSLSSHSRTEDSMRRTILTCATAAALTLVLSACNKPEEPAPTDTPPATTEPAPAPEPMTEPAPTEPATPPPTDPNAPPTDETQTPPASPEEPPADSTTPPAS
jgi:outer membrane biosynthesis protein TonB